MMNQKLFFIATLMIGVVVSSCTSTRFAEKKFQEAKQVEPYDVVIVPGVPYMDKGFGSVFAARILWAKYLMDSGITKNVIFSGAAVATPYTEGIAMKVIADSLGTDPKHTFSETRAEHSTENAYYGMKMAQKMGLIVLHWPLIRFKRSRCEKCSRNVATICLMCLLFLCVLILLKSANYSFQQ
jgi:uncharacterized SAM-binding protein YcdF (DUF218 family)